MLEEMVKILPEFLGKEAHVCCFAHTVNLTAKGILRPFEPAKSSTSMSSDGPGVGLNELYAELVQIQEEGDEDDDTEGFVEVLEDMSDEEREKWQTEVEPVRMALFKVSCYHLSFIFPLCYHHLIYFPLTTGSQNFKQDYKLNHFALASMARASV